PVSFVLFTVPGGPFTSPASAPVAPAPASAATEAATTSNRLVIVAPLSIEVRIEDADLGDAIHGQRVACRRPADRLRRRSVVDAECNAAFVADIRVNPGHALFRIALQDAATLVDRDRP